ncbi:MAG: ERF family protein [Anaerostipes sp.]|nr:ERF family protein [Anaerostipes sp.]MDD3747623.1 ERF family protein [Anaerostipes sp.]
MEIQEKLLVIQTKLNAPKNQYNKFGNYNYRNCEDILEALKPLLEEVKASVVITDEISQVGERFYIKATVNFIDIETDKTIAAQAFAREAVSKKGMDESQITGATSSYARKYALNGLFLIDDTKDADSNEFKKNSDKKSKEQENVPPKNQAEDKEIKVTKAMVTTIEKELARTNVDANTILDCYKVKLFEDLTVVQYKNFMNRMKKTPTYEG